MKPDDFLIKGLAIMGLEVDRQTISLLCRYFEELCRWNKKMNLVAQAAPEQILENHFLDSLTLLKIIESRESASLLDVGSGAGFPGLVLQAVCRELQVTLVEPRLKRVSFLKHVIRTLALQNISVLSQRLEQKQVSAIGPFSLITSRAFTDMESFLRLVDPYCAVNGKIICMKGPKAEEELLAIQHKTILSRYSLTQKVSCALPFSRAHRTLLVFTKEKNQ
ncbi:MAG: 16S rRNA (guanine(527)-N(7))-methyltransferase RsmG [Proteobacteria bacterium]|nr:16S rRNA (guanine(527)-N(7))-methyltransferase RsmG [Pseudomonadota bacterium]MBU1711170.1 16S rRNA (guanine(527)-N(7))-methyltransferase RsmG [Pseudomonadota bacterium]